MPARGHPQISEVKAARIIALHEEGFSYRYIASRVSVHPSSVGNVVQRYKKHHTYSPLPRPGRPSSVSARMRRQIIRTICANRFASYQQISDLISGTTRSMVQKVAHEEGYRRCVAVTKPALKPPMVNQWLTWADENTGRNWALCMWTDETSIGIGGAPGRVMVTRKPNEAYLPECLVSSYHSGRDSMMVWGAVAHGAKGPIVRLEMMPHSLTSSGRKRGGGLSAQGYADQVVSGPMKDFWEALRKERGQEIVIVEDGAGPHKGKLVQRMRDKFGMKRLTHPPNSPDLNPIEPLWFLLKKRVARIPGYRSSRDNLWAAIQQAWDSITIEEINKHTGKMEARVEAVKAANGYHTRF